MKKLSSRVPFLFAEDYRTTTSGWHRDCSCFRRYGLELVSKPATSLKKEVGGVGLGAIIP